jgi:dipeptidyl aminopeptidase/acylaminoacyl peptidase
MKFKFAVVLCILTGSAFSQRPLQPSDVYRLKSVSDPQPSPDGQWVAYVLSTPDSAKDRSDADIWMVSWDGQTNLRLTTSPDGESQPRWSPDGRYLTFMSSRYDTKTSQIWRMDRRGGEAEKFTSLKVSIGSYVWSPDSKKLVLVIRDQESAEEAEKKKTKKPIVIDRYHFKSDGEGYLERKRNHIYVYDIELKKLDTLTRGDFDNSSPAWSPDSRYIAFVSNRTPDPDRNGNTDIWIVEAKQGSTPRQLTTWPDSDGSPQWSPDGQSIAYLKSQTPEYDIYDQEQIAVLPAAGGTPRVLAPTLDRQIYSFRWTPDGRSISGILEDDRRANVCLVDVASGKVTPMTAGDQVFSQLQPAGNGRWVSLRSDTQTPNELFALENGQPRQLTHVHDEFLKGIRLASVEGFTSKSKDGTVVGNLLYWPYGLAANAKPPCIFWIHGGPTSQDDYSFDFTSQILASNGFAVVNVNYRGSGGRGMAFSRAIFGDWGGKEVVDIIGAADHLVASGKVDANRLGIGGWSYGGILTDYTTATDPRFKAAASGAGSALQLSMYGSDQYILQYETELGVPWKNLDKWMKVSYPFMKVEKIKTPTLYMVGEKDFNVPAAGGEQMYQALKSLGVPTEFVIYPGQYHGIAVPSYQIDRMKRYQDWFEKYLANPKLSETLPVKK